MNDDNDFNIRAFAWAWLLIMGMLAVGIAVIIASKAYAETPGHALHHDNFYSTLKQPSNGKSCCNSNDCRPAQHRVTSRGVEFLIAGEWHVMEKSKIIETSTPDDAVHWCGYGDNWEMPKPFTYCAVIPLRSF